MRYKDGLLVCLAVGAGAALTGCTTVIGAPGARRPEGMPSANRGQSSAMLFATEPVVVAMLDTPEWSRPEYGRNDENLAYSPPRALTAIDHWPQPLAPSLSHAHRTTLSRSARTIIHFERPYGAHRHGLHHGRSRYHEYGFRGRHVP